MTLSSINGVGNTNHLLTSQTKINSKWIKDLNVRPKTLRIVEENISSMLFDFRLTIIIIGLCLQARATKAKINKCHCINLKSFLYSGTIRKMERQTTEWEKLFANDMSYKRLIFKIYK